MRMRGNEKNNEARVIKARVLISVCLVRPNGPELSCGDVQRRRGSHSARGMSCPIVAVCFARAKSSTAGSVSLSDWLGSPRVSQ